MTKGLVARGINHVIGTFYPPSQPLVGREGLVTELITNAQCCNKKCLCNISSIKIKKDEVWRILRLVETEGIYVPGE